jgi:hypothetical protein
MNKTRQSISINEETKEILEELAQEMGSVSQAVTFLARLYKMRQKEATTRAVEFVADALSETFKKG